MTSYALVGSGASAAIWAQTIAGLDGHELRAVHARRRDQAERLAAAYGAGWIERDALATAADVLVVTTAPPAHADEALDLARRGAAVIVEAPLASTLAGADALVAEADAGGRIAYAESLLFSPLVREAVDRVRHLGASHYLGARVVQPSPVRRTALDANWGGGVLFDLGPHPLAVLLTLAGEDHPVSVRAELQHDGSLHSVDRSASVTLQLASGATAALEVAWQDDAATWDLQVAGAASALRLELLPEPHLEQQGVDLPRPGRRYPTVEPEQVELFGYADQVIETGTELAARRSPYVNVRFGRYVLDVICAAYHSARTGAAETIPFGGDRTRTPWELWRGDDGGDR